MSWDLRYLRLAKMVALWSKDPSTKCGAILVRNDKTMASVGYNGFARGTVDDAGLYADRASKYPRIIHSEWNAIANCKDGDLSGYTVYAWPMAPCSKCTGALIQKGVSRIVHPVPELEKLERWGVDFQMASHMLKQCGIPVDHCQIDDQNSQWLPLLDPNASIWTQRFIHMAREVAGWSKDPLEPRGTVIIRPDKTVASIGFSGFPKGVDDAPLINGDEQARKSCLVVSERNALLFSRDHQLTGCTAYSWPGAPSLDSVSHLMHSGIRTCVYSVSGARDNMTEEAKDWFTNAGGQVIPVQWKILADKDNTLR